MFKNTKEALDGFSQHMPWGDVRRRYEPILRKAYREIEEAENKIKEK